MQSIQKMPLLFKIKQYLGDNISERDVNLMIDFLNSKHNTVYGKQTKSNIKGDASELVGLMINKGDISATNNNYTKLIECLNIAQLKGIAEDVQKFIDDDEAEKQRIDDDEAEKQRSKEKKQKVKKRPHSSPSPEDGSEQVEEQRTESATNYRNGEVVENLASSGTCSAAAATAAATVASPRILDEDPDSELSDGLEYLDASREDLDLISLRLTPCRKRRIKELFTSDSVYRMEGPIRGRCVIMNNMKFAGPLETRDGSEMDAKNLSRVFKALGFVVVEHKDLTSKAMKDVIRSETKHESQALYGMFVLAVLSHGAENQVYGKDGEAVELSTIYDLLSAYKFPAMAGKPKVVIIQACNGKKVDAMGSTMPDGPTPNKIPKPMISSSSTSAANPAVRTPLPGEFLSTSDLYIMKASFHGFVSARHTRSGTWFIRALVEALYKHACHRDIESLFKQVQEKVTMRSQQHYRQTRDARGQQPTAECTFTKGRKLYLFPEYNPEPVT